MLIVNAPSLIDYPVMTIQERAAALGLARGASSSVAEPPAK